MKESEAPLCQHNYLGCIIIYGMLIQYCVDALTNFRVKPHRKILEDIYCTVGVILEIKACS